MWRGLLLNTLFFATLAFVALVVPTAFRSMLRRRRGHCPRCGYDLKHDLAAGCPECGWGRTVQLTSATPVR